MPGVVTVGCKLPAGMHLTLWKMEKGSEAVMGGGVREIERAVPAGRITIRGSARKVNEMASLSEIAFGYGITPNVDADSWNEWVKHNKSGDAFTKGFVFAHAKQADVVAQARDGEKLRSGLEPIDPTNLPDEFKRKIKTATLSDN